MKVNKILNILNRFWQPNVAHFMFVPPTHQYYTVECCLVMVLNQISTDNSFLNFPLCVVDASGWQQEITWAQRHQMRNSIWNSHLLGLISVCGCAFCERLNPLLSNDAFMLHVASSPSSHFPSSVSSLIKRKGEYASNIKWHQSPHAVYVQCFLSFKPSLSFLVFFCIHITCLQTVFDVEYQQTLCVCSSTTFFMPPLHPVTAPL